MENICFICKYFSHLNPDDDYCKLYDKIVYTFTPACSSFLADGFIVDN